MSINTNKKKYHWLVINTFSLGDPNQTKQQHSRFVTLDSAKKLIVFPKKKSIRVCPTKKKPIG